MRQAIIYFIRFKGIVKGYIELRIINTDKFELIVKCVYCHLQLYSIV